MRIVVSIWFVETYCCWSCSLRHDWIFFWKWIFQFEIIGYFITKFILFSNYIVKFLFGISVIICEVIIIVLITLTIFFIWAAILSHWSAGEMSGP